MDRTRASAGGFDGYRPGDYPANPPEAGAPADVPRILVRKPGGWLDGTACICKL